jgi:hypothetical protein
MIKFEHNMLVLNNTFSDDDVREINAFADYVRNQERERIFDLLEEWRDNGTLMSVEFLIELIKGEN